MNKKMEYSPRELEVIADSLKNGVNNIELRIDKLKAEDNYDPKNWVNYDGLWAYSRFEEDRGDCCGG